MANLGNDEKTKIREEEAFRFEVQKELNSQFPKKWYAHVWKFFNSSIMIVAMIAVVVWFGGKEFLRDNDEREAQRERMHAVELLKLEINYQATQTKKYLENVIRYMESDKTPKLDEAISELLAQVRATDLAELLSQLKLVSEPSGGMRRTLDDAFVSTLKLQIMGDDIHGYKAKATISELVEETKRQLNHLASLTGKSYLTNGENFD